MKRGTWSRDWPDIGRRVVGVTCAHRSVAEGAGRRRDPCDRTNPPVGFIDSFMVFFALTELLTEHRSCASS